MKNNVIVYVYKIECGISSKDKYKSGYYLRASPFLPEKKPVFETFENVSMDKREGMKNSSKKMSLEKGFFFVLSPKIVIM